MNRYGGPGVRVRLLFSRCDLWIGACWRKRDRCLFIQPLPCICFAIQFGINDGMWMAINEAIEQDGKLKERVK